MKNKPLMILGGCLVLLVICIIVSVLGIFGLGQVYKSLDELEIDFVQPEVIVAGESFDWEVVVNNTGEKAIRIVEVEIEQSILEGVEIDSSSPVFTDVEDTSVFGFELLSYYYEDLTIEPGETVSIVFKMKALRTGSFAGTVTLYSDRLYNSIESYERFYIE